MVHSSSQEHCRRNLGKSLVLLAANSKQRLSNKFQTTGPVSIATYMRQCLTSPDGGYYTKGKDPFGQKGDFVTSPEISQIFGELLGIWMVAEWIAQGKISQGVEIIEVGPGRGTLMGDMLRVWYDAMTTNWLRGQSR